jgi:hypothetical protein
VSSKELRKLRGKLRLLRLLQHVLLRLPTPPTLPDPSALPILTVAYMALR